MSDTKKRSPAMEQKVKMCKLIKDGKLDEVRDLSVRPVVVCGKCRATANNPSSLCNPRMLKS